MLYGQGTHVVLEKDDIDALNMLLAHRGLPCLARCVQRCGRPAPWSCSCLTAARRHTSTSQACTGSASLDAATHAESIAALIDLSDALLAHEAGITLPPASEAAQATTTTTNSSGSDGEIADDTQAIMQLCLDPLVDDTRVAAGSSSSNALDHTGDNTSNIATNNNSSSNVEAQVRAWLTRSSDDAATSAAAALVLRGLDMKALLRDGTLSHLSLHGQSLRQCDFSTTTWHGVQATRCDFALCLFYAAQLCDVTFVDCCFDGAVWSKTRCRGEVRFVRCRFYRAAMGFVCDAAYNSNNNNNANDGNGGTSTAQDADSEGKTSTRRGGASILFEACDFDLADFGSCRGLRRPTCFRGCHNYDTAANFPLRTHGRE